jgi:hypothetical protein
MSHEFVQLDGTFPMSRERLATIKTEYDNYRRERYVKLSVDIMSQRIIEEAYGGKNIKYVQLYLTDKMVRDPQVRSILPSQPTAESQLPEILNKLKERFPDCEITMDPMKTYIYVSW